ncbi:hypothetical protein CHO01_16420 [Cellulomonas hominis]|uniref:NERD domain-containing protein n=1 Tax=Cellulomonas hominis TaxID=156981 RepID=A0A511FB85_9CELL|nr:nuclease-related domain-containing protein [Cellulomonas hominis]MBB5472753.1 hypothetical protein [Cellulomonas hominis]GEL46526.1 hypothetical protein CHO01_16420 [Cellulomonas hominis]
MVHGFGQPAARRARRLGRRRAGTAAGLPRARTQADAWFDAWLSGDAAPADLEVPDGWTVLRGLHRPGSGVATVERIAVGPGGIVVVETVRWPGEVAVVNGTLRHQGYGRTPDAATVADAAGAVTALLAPTHRRAVRAVLRLAGHDLDPVAVRGGAVALGEQQATAYLAALPEQLSAPDVRLVVDYLAAELGGPSSPEQLTLDDVFRSPAVWSAPDVPGPRALRDAPRYTAPANPPGHPDQEPEDARPAPARGLVGEGLLRVGLLVLGLLTAGNVLLAWLDAAG